MKKLGYQEIINKLKEIKSKGYIQTRRAGDTGIGKTLEDILGIKESNIPGPNAEMIELKSARKESSSMLTLFTKSPFPRRKAISALVEKFGYQSRKGRKILHSTLKATSYTNIKGRKALIVGVNDKIEIISVKGELLGYWDIETLKKVFERKLPAILYVKADCKGSGSAEEFWFNEAWFLKGFSFDNFKELIRNGTICVDLRIGQYPNGRAHDHGTAFRILSDKLELAFGERKRIV